MILDMIYMLKHLKTTQLIFYACFVSHMDTVAGFKNYSVNILLMVYVIGYLYNLNLKTTQLIFYQRTMAR